MRKIILAIALLMTVSFGARAQRDGFFNAGSYEGGSRDDIGTTTPILPHGSVGQTNGDQPATVPVGEGLLILSMLGGAYLLKRREK